MQDSLINRVGSFLAAQGLLDPTALILVAVSGGPDSLCLLHVLAGLARIGGPQLHVAHLDHGFRGAQSAAEARAVAEIAAAWGLPVTVSYADVPALARASGEGNMAAARRARYAFLAQVAAAQGAAAVAVAHNADDQAETVLLHALRGAGPAGLRGMRAVVRWAEWAEQEEAGGRRQEAGGGSSLIRPLLEITRAEILAYCAEHELAPADDPSNRSPRYARSRLRHGLLLVLAEHNPQVVAALGRTAQICAEDYDFLQRVLDAAWPGLASERPGRVELNLEAWRGLHPALRRYALRRAAARLGLAELSFAQVEAARSALDAGSPRTLEVAHGLRMFTGEQSVTLEATDAPPEQDGPQLIQESLRVAVPGHTPLGGGWVCVATPEPPARPSAWWLAVPVGLGDNLALRRRRAGERFRPAGGRGSRRLQDFFVDRKLPRQLRDAWPILVAGAQILWVVGLRADARITSVEAGEVIWVGLIRETEEEEWPDDAR
jgi:tRNA(Ile)-lysidine synthase